MQFNRIVIDLPDHWRDGSTIELRESAPDDLLPATISITRTEFEGDTQAAQVEQSLKEGMRAVPGCEILASEVTEIGGFPAHRLDLRLESAQGPTMRRTQAILLNGAESLVLVCTGTEARYASFEKVFQQAVESLRLLPVGGRS